MDWVAVGSVGAVAAALIAYLQYRHSRRPPPSVAEVKHRDPPTLNYDIADGRGRYPLPDGWQAPIQDQRWILHQQMEHDLESISFALVTLRNNNAYPLERISVQLRASSCWSARVESTKNLAESAVMLSISKEGVEIRIDEMPKSEEIVVSLLLGGVVGSTLRSTNAAVKLKSKWD